MTNELSLVVEKKLRQIILTDLINQSFGRLYKYHLELMLSWLKLLVGELRLSKSITKILFTAAYGYHWGCGNLFSLEHAHPTNPTQHLSSCFELAAVKIERFAYYHFSKFFSQHELLSLASLIQEQAVLDSGTKNNEMATLLWEASVLAWFELIQFSEEIEVGKKERRIIGQVNRDQFLEQKDKFYHQVSKQAFLSLLA